MMKEENLIVFKGSKSQTGIAFRKQFPEIFFEESSLDFDDIKNEVAQGGTPKKIVLPIWNSHFGEVTVSHALTMVFEEAVKIYMLWPERIKFECVIKRDAIEGCEKVVSVSVAEQQCSNYIDKHGLSFHEEGSTTVAYEKFKTNPNFHAALCAPGTSDGEYEVCSNDVANPINFTTFAILATEEVGAWVNANQESTSQIEPSSAKTFSALEMPFYPTFTDSQEELFKSFIDGASSIEELPKVIFVSVADGSNCRLLLESDTACLPDEILDEDGADDMLRILPNVGHTKYIYSTKVDEFLREHSFIDDGDFLEHRGTKSCFFACPTFGILTHGFDREATEFIVRHMVIRCFELIDAGGGATDAQRELYKKYLDDYREHGADFFKFTIIGGEEVNGI